MLLTLLRWPPRRRPNRTGSRTAPQPFLSDSQWLLIADLFPDPPVGPKEAGRGSRRRCLEGVMWVLSSAAPAGKIYQTGIPLRHLLASASRLVGDGVARRVGPAAGETVRAAGPRLARPRSATARFYGQKRGRRRGTLSSWKRDPHPPAGRRPAARRCRPSSPRRPSRSQLDRVAGRRVHAAVPHLSVCCTTKRRTPTGCAQPGRPRDRAALPAPREPHAAAASRWSPAAALQAQVDGRADHQLAAQLPPT